MRQGRVFCLSYSVASAKLELISVVSGMEQVMEGPLWDKMLPFLSPLDVSSLRTSTKEWNRAGEYGPLGELFSLRKKSNDPAVSTPFGMYESMRVVEQDSALGCNHGLVKTSGSS